MAMHALVNPATIQPSENCRHNFEMCAAKPL
jgi:hypothetical protein